MEMRIPFGAGTTPDLDHTGTPNPPYSSNDVPTLHFWCWHCHHTRTHCDQSNIHGHLYAHKHTHSYNTLLSGGHIKLSSYLILSIWLHTTYLKLSHTYKYYWFISRNLQMTKQIYYTSHKLSPPISYSLNYSICSHINWFWIPNYWITS